MRILVTRMWGSWPLAARCIISDGGRGRPWLRKPRCCAWLWDVLGAVVVVAWSNCHWLGSQVSDSQCRCSVQWHLWPTLGALLAGGAGGYV